MSVVLRTLRTVVWFGLTLYVAFLLPRSFAAEGSARGAGAGRPAADAPPLPAPASAAAANAGHPLANGMFPPPPGTPTPYGPLPPPTPPFRDTPYGAHANPGPPGSPGWGHPHLPEYQFRYGIWYQPDSFHEPTKAVYRPSPFRPRGWGNLFYEPCRRDRMDYVRPVVKDLPSRYGPAYYPHYSQPSECLVRPERHYTPPVWGAAE